MAGRAQEPAGLQAENVDLENRTLKVCDVVVWAEQKKFLYLKEVPKNGEQRLVYINDQMFKVLKRRMGFLKPKLCAVKRESNGKVLNFVFHNKGQPLTYREIQHQYTSALKKAQLWPEFSGTHILRKAMANITRQSMGLEAAQAVGGWKDMSIVQKIYTNHEPEQLNRSAVTLVGDLLGK